VHHGDGTQEQFLKNPNVLVFSIHRYDNGNFFPYRQSAAAEVIGEDDGRFFNVNVPWDLPASASASLPRLRSQTLSNTTNQQTSGESNGRETEIREVPGDAEYLAAFDSVPCVPSTSLPMSIQLYAQYCKHLLCCAWHVLLAV
jgi:hypothetical protein